MGQTGAEGLEADAAVTKSSNGGEGNCAGGNCFGGRPRHARRWSSLAGALLLLSCISFRILPGTTALAGQSSVARPGYVGSRVCSQCHPSVYESFVRTDMGRSMSGTARAEITPAMLEKMPASNSIFDAKLNRHFEIYEHDGSLYQSE
jgi:hypothetical protein